MVIVRSLLPRDLCLVGMADSGRAAAIIVYRRRPMMKGGVVVHGVRIEYLRSGLNAGGGYRCSMYWASCFPRTVARLPLSGKTALNGRKASSTPLGARLTRRDSLGRDGAGVQRDRLSDRVQWLESFRSHRRQGRE